MVANLSLDGFLLNLSNFLQLLLLLLFRFLDALLFKSLFLLKYHLFGVEVILYHSIIGIFVNNIHLILAQAHVPKVLLVQPKVIVKAEVETIAQEVTATVHVSSKAHVTHTHIVHAHVAHTHVTEASIKRVKARTVQSVECVAANQIVKHATRALVTHLWCRIDHHG